MRQTQPIVIAYDTTQRRRMTASHGTTRLLWGAFAVASVLDKQRLERAPLDDGDTVGFQLCLERQQQRVLAWCGLRRPASAMGARQRDTTVE